LQCGASGIYGNYIPAKNTVKTYSPDSYYHIYNRGVAKKTIYHDEEDYAVFMNLLKRYLDIEPPGINQGGHMSI
jgi:hypothetical protein